MQDYQKDFICYAVDCGVLKFGEFLLKSGRISPYFFNTGLFNTGAQLAKLGQFYAQALLQSGLKPDVLFGPAYKGIPLVSTTAIGYAQLTNSDIPFAFNRKEEKDHGEGGVIVGAPLVGDVLILDDVITAGTSIRESVQIIRSMQATPVGVLIALDREEKGQNNMSAVEEASVQHGIPVNSIITLGNIIEYLAGSGAKEIDAIMAYQKLYGIGNL